MMNDMRIFRTTVGVAPWSNPDNRADVADVTVDTGSEYNWMPEELLARLGLAPVARRSLREGRRQNTRANYWLRDDLRWRSVSAVDRRLRRPR